MARSLRILDDGNRISLEEAAELLKVSLATIRRYCRGELEYMATGPEPGSRYLTSREAVERYLARLNPDAPEAAQEVPAPIEAAASRIGPRQPRAGVGRDLTAQGTAPDGWHRRGVRESGVAAYESYLATTPRATPAA